MRTLLLLIWFFLFAVPGLAETGQLPSKVVLIVIDTLRADHLPVYGYKENTAPFISQLGKQGVVFERALSTSSWTSPATASIHTGLYPSQHGVLMGMNATRRLFREDATQKLNRIPEEAETLAESFKKKGYSTFAITDNGNICEGLGFDQGFEHFHNFEMKRATAVGIEKKMLEWEAELKAKDKYFLYLHYMDPHSPYNKRKPWYKSGGSNQANLINAYDSEIRFTDEHIKVLYKRFGWDKDTVIVLTSDHGEEFWEHGKQGHGKALYVESIHVPLIFYSSNALWKPTRISEWASNFDVTPTLRSLLELPPVPYQSAVNLLPVLRGEAFPERDSLRAEIWKRLPTGVKMEQYALTESDWRYHQVRRGNWETGAWKPEGNPELYNLAQDPKETTNLAEGEDQQVERLAQVLSGTLKGQSQLSRQLIVFDFNKKIELSKKKKKS